MKADYKAGLNARENAENAMTADLVCGSPTSAADTVSVPNRGRGKGGDAPERH